MITMSEMLIHNSISDVPIECQWRIEALLKKLNVIRAAYGRPMVPTNVYRTQQYHLDLYRRLGKRAPMGSKHLTGDAADIADDGSLYTFLHDKPELMESLDLYGEKDTKGWCHLQQVKFASYKPGGSRWFNP